MSDVVLTLSAVPDGPGHLVTAAWGPGSARVEVTATVPAFDRAALEAEYLRPLRAFTERDLPGGLLEALGKELSGLLLPAPVREALCAAALHAPERLRVRLEVRPAHLAELPWEFLYLDGLPGGLPEGFLALHPRFDLVRQAQATAPSVAVDADPLRVLVAWADPGSPRYALLPELRAEVVSVLAALGAPECRRVVVDELPYATPVALERHLASRPPHVLHFIGHGDERPSGGLLVLQGERAGAEAPVYGEELARWLRAGSRREVTTRLVVLSACRTAGPGRGIGAVLAREGVPAVVAMQLPLRDGTAGLLARAFYAALVEPRPVDAALREARQAVRGAGPDWGVPVLYLGAETGDLFRPAPPAARSAGGRAEAPTNLPYLRNPQFVGRKRLLTELHHSLQFPDGRPAALVGMGGIGKSQVAVEYAHAHRAAYPGGVFWINAPDAERVREDYASLGRFFDLPDSLPPPERAARVRDALQQLEEPALLVWDNATERTDFKLLPAVGACRILITTRQHYLAHPRCRVLPVHVLETEHALALLQAARTAEGPEERRAAREIADLVGSLPLALALAAHHVRRLDLDFAAYRERLAPPDHRFEVLTRARSRFIASTEHESSVFDVIDLSCRSLAADAAAVLAAASCFAGRGISPDLLREGSGVPREAFEEAAADLEDSCLLSRDEDRRLSVHELVRVYAHGHMTDEQRGEVAGRAAAALTRRLEEARAERDWAPVRRELVHCRAAAEHCRAAGCSGALYPLLREMGCFHFEHRDLDPAAECLREALTVAEAVGGRRRLETADVLLRLGELEQHLQRPEAALAHVREAREIAAAVLPADTPEFAEYSLGLGYVLKMQGELEQALPYYREALQIHERRRGRRDREVATCLNNIGTLLEDARDLDGALAHLTEALEIDRELSGPRHRTVASRLNNIGRVLRKQGRWAEAAARHRESVEIYEAAYGRRHLYTAMSMAGQAEAERRLGERESARRLYEEALEVLERHYGPDHAYCRAIREGLRLLEE